MEAAPKCGAILACMCCCCCLIKQVRERKTQPKVDASNHFENSNDLVSDPKLNSTTVVTEQPAPPDFDANSDTTKEEADHELNTDEISL